MPRPMENAQETPDHPEVDQRDLSNAGSNDHVSFRHVKSMISQLSAACKLRHDEILHKMVVLETKITNLDRKLTAHRLACVSVNRFIR